MRDQHRPCDCKGPSVGRPQKTRPKKTPTPLSDFEQVRNEALGAADRASYIMADSMAKNKVAI